MKVAPSILSVFNQNLDEILFQLAKADIKYLHLDVMDNKFVPNYTFDETFVYQIKQKTSFILDTHLMIEEPFNQIDRYIKSGSDYLCFHIEATKNPQMIIDKIKEASLKVGIAIKPKTPLDVILPYLPFFRFSFGNERRARFWRSKIYGRSSLQNGRISENKKKVCISIFN